MGQFSYVVTDEVGLHARPAGELVKLVREYGEKVTVAKGDKSVNASGLMGLMGLGIHRGDEITVECQDPTVLEKLKQFMQEHL